MFSKKTIPASTHISDHDFHSLIAKRVLGSAKEGKVGKVINHWPAVDTISHKAYDVLNKHGFIKKGRKYEDGTADVKFHDHKLKELNNNLTLAHSMYAQGYHAGEKK